MTIQLRVVLSLVVLSSMAASSRAMAAGRAVVFPVVVGSGAEPSETLIAELSKGLAQGGGQWTVVHGTELLSLLATEPAMSQESETQLASKLEALVQKAAAADATAESVSEIAALRAELASAAKKGPLGPKGQTLAYRAAALHVAALLAANEPDRAKTVAEEVALLFPARKPADSDVIPAPAAELLRAAAPAAGGPKLSLTTRPERCDVWVNGVSVGTSPVDVLVLPGATYYAEAICGGPGAPASATLRSHPRRIDFGEKDTQRKEFLDAEFERQLQAEQGMRIRFASQPERRKLDETYARRLAERFGADAVVLASVGELSGSDWLNGRLYLSSGYLNRQGFVRLETARAAALGRFLATGKEVPGVLRPEEAGALVASMAQTAEGGPQSKVAAPWYTDIVGWCFTGAGLAGVSYGLWMNSRADRTTNQADALRGDSAKQDGLYREAQRDRFLGGIGVVGGGLMTATGVVLLLIPEYSSAQGELFVFSPISGGGGAVTFSGRF